MGLLDEAIREHLDLKRARGADPAEIERLEREALGPVRRDPSIASMAPDPELESADESEGDDYVDGLPGSPPEEQVEEAEPPQPKRRFLRRHRGAERAADERDAQASAHDLDDGEYAAYLERHEHDEDHGDEPATEMHQAVEPPQLTFNQPPSRPRFAEEPLSSEPSDASEAMAAEALAGEALGSGEGAEPDTSGSAPRESARHHHDLQPTHEFDVEGAFHDEPAPGQVEDRNEPADGKPRPVDDSEEPAEQREAAAGDREEPAEEQDAAAEDEDVLEETPEFLQETPEHDRLWFEQRPPKDFDFDG
jgi:hypothetical protein